MSIIRKFFNWIRKRKRIVCKDTDEVVYSYQEYLQTTHWKRMRQVVAILANYKCKKCKKRMQKGFHVHHLTYKRLGREKVEDLQFLCPDCHNKLHASEKRKCQT